MKSLNLLNEFEPLFESEILATTLNVNQQDMGVVDPSHDILHFKRVVKLARQLAIQENAKFEVVIPAAWFHDYVAVAKNDSRRNQASRLSAEQAMQFLRSRNYPEIYLSEIAHAIECHSFSAGIKPTTLESCIVQDADRLDAIGAIGIARCFTVGALMKRPFYHLEDAFCSKREVDDSQYTLDHFYKKLFVIAETMKTKAGQREAFQRLEFMKKYIEQLKLEI